MDTYAKELAELCNRLVTVESNQKVLIKQLSTLQKLVQEIAKEQGHSGPVRTSAFADKAKQGAEIPEGSLKSEYLSDKHYKEIKALFESYRDENGDFKPDAGIVIRDTQWHWDGWYCWYIASQKHKRNKLHNYEVRFSIAENLIKKSASICRDHGMKTPRDMPLEDFYEYIQPMLRPGGFQSLRDFDRWDDVPSDICANVMFYHHNKNLAQWWMMSPSFYARYLELMGVVCSDTSWMKKLLRFSTDSWDAIPVTQTQICEWICKTPGYPNYKSMSPAEFIEYVKSHPIFSVY